MSRKNLFFYCFVSIVILAFLIVGCGSDQKASAGLAKISEITGQVTVNSAAAVKDQQLKENDVVEVGKDSMATIAFLHDNTKVHLFYSEKNAANSKLVIKPVKNDGKTFVVNLLNGLLTFFVPPVENRQGNFEITADDAVVSIYQTMGKVENSPEQIAVALVRGKVGVSLGGSELKVEADQQWIYEKKTKAAPEVKAYDSANADDEKLYARDKGTENTDINLDGRK
ncbi:MAG: FecR family protein [Candidatus Riflebacteria bacterium]